MQTNSQFAVSIHVLSLLACYPEEPLTSEILARSVTTNPVVIRRILGSLRRAGLVTSQPGNGGGWRLAKDPSSIPLHEAYAAVQQGSCFALAPKPPNEKCVVGCSLQSVLREVFDEAETAMKSQLSTCTLQDIVRKVQECAPTQPDSAFLLLL